MTTKKFSNVVSLILAVLIISACASRPTQRSRSDEEIAVYSALINEQLEVPFGYLMGDPIIIVNRTSYESVEDDILYAGAPSLDNDTVKNFREENIGRYTLDLPLSVNKPYEYMSWPTDENGWMEFGQKFPHAITITAISKIGFNKKMNQALVYMAYYCGTECGMANVYFMTRKGDTWMIEATIEIWVS